MPKSLNLGNDSAGYSQINGEEKKSLFSQKMESVTLCAVGSALSSVVGFYRGCGRSCG